MGEKAGLHVAIQIPGYIFDRKLQLMCEEKGIAISPCSMYALGSRKYDDTLLLGYGNIDNEKILNGVNVLSQICRFHLNSIPQHE
jgi:GntR family transcriptional regulator/MocR family aminotransferase